MTKEQMLLRECIRQILSEAVDFSHPPKKIEDLKPFELALKSDIGRAKAQAEFDKQDAAEKLPKDRNSEQYIDQGDKAKDIFNLIDKNENDSFDENEIPTEKEWFEDPALKQKFNDLYAVRLAKAKMQTQAVRDRQAAEKRRSEKAKAALKNT